MKLKAAVSGKSEASIIAECERGEDAAMRNYENVLEENLLSDLLAIVEMQYAKSGSHLLRFGPIRRKP